jgi:hypothetical protein
MTTRLARQIGGIAGMSAFAVMVTACGGGSAKVASAAVSPGSSQVAAAASPGDVSAAPVHATGGGTFCREIAASMNSEQANATSASGSDIKKQLDAARASGHHALSIAPSAIKPDVALLVTASDSMYDALAKVGDDYSKLTPADMTAFSSPAVMAAEQHLTAYLKGTCGIDIGAQAAAAASGAAAPADGSDAAAASDAADNTGPGCKLATVAEISTAAGKPMKLVGGALGICAYSAVDGPSFALEASIYEDTASMTTMTTLENAGSEHLDGLGDDAFWNGTIGTVFVRKGTRAFSFSLQSFANLTDDPAAVKSKMVTLATAVAARF